MTITDELLEKIGKLTLVEAAELVKKMEEKFGISTAAPVAVAASPAAGGVSTQQVQEEPSSYNVVLKASGEKKVDVIKVVREITGLGLKEAKELVEKGNQSIKDNVSKEQAQELKKKLEAAGAVVELTPA
ncbi:MAG: 50S ribosomal protein L7/L12 [Leptonema sp. (in: bacteria)]